jgi:predicted nucleic acid-binding protein
MNLVDSCGWIGYLADGENADFFAIPLQDTENLIVPSICIFEVFKKVLQDSGESSAFQVVALMYQGQVIDLDMRLAIGSAELSFELKLPLADSVILATSKLCNSIIWTQDKHFKGMKDVKYIEKGR